jgi:hypothetical protein
LIQKVFSKSNSSFTALRLGHNILWEMRKDGQKEGALLIISSFRYVQICSVKEEKVYQSSIFSIVLFPKRPPRMAKQMQARYPDHGNPLQKALKLEPKNPSALHPPPYQDQSHTRHCPTGLYPLLDNSWRG